jgi:hypothetical protein
MLLQINFTSCSLNSWFAFSYESFNYKKASRAEALFNVGWQLLEDFSARNV